jgi:hypothetical protein
VQRVWGGATDEGIARVRDGLLDAVAALDRPVAEWRAAVVGVQTPDVVTAADDAAVDLALLTAADGKQRGVPLGAEDLQELHDLRVALRPRFAGDERLAHVMPWVRNGATSGGQALTSGGAEHGFELRLSHYRKRLY